MAKYFVEIAYFGRAYHGWQVQPNEVTVQSTLDEKLSTIFNQSITTVGCGRTDAGVHAKQFFAHFETEAAVPDKFLYRINKMLPMSIELKRIYEVEDWMHARYRANYRAYEYYIHFNKDAFLSEHSYFYPWLPLDIPAMQKAFKMMQDFKDFRAFCKTGGNQNHYLCDIYETKLELDELTGKLKFRIAANRFLRGMVRRIVGCLLSVGKGKITLEEFELILREKKKFKLNISVPPQGLYLVEVRYVTSQDDYWQVPDSEE